MSTFEQPKRYYIHGATGTGKTFYAYQLAKKYGQEPYFKTSSGYWENYNGQKVVVLDDVTPDQMQYLMALLPKWADYHSFTTKEKRDPTNRVLIPSKQINPCNYTLLLCSCYEPDDLFTNVNAYTRAKLDRLFEYKHLNADSLEEIKNMNMN